MKTILRILCCFLAAVSAFAAAASAQAATRGASSLAFVDVTVIPMDSERTLPRQTVIVTGDRITEIGASSRVTIPEGAQRIDGAGKFLIPGLAEMHGHNPPPGSSQQYIESVYFLFLANGVTTVRSMQGWPGQLELREQVKRGEILGPTLYLAGPGFSGSGANAVRSPEAAVARVQEQKTEGWDLLKVLPGLKRDVYDAMARTAKDAGIEFSGHIPADVGLVHAIEQGQRTVDHLDGYIEHLDAKNSPIDRMKLAAIVKLTRDTGTWVVPTMVLWETIIGAANAGELASFPELKYMPRATVDGWRRNYVRKLSSPNFNAMQAAQIAANRKVLLKALADGGARILFGTDAPQQYSVPGFSIHRELAAMKDVGMGNFAILQSATKNVGDYYKDIDKTGIVAVGARADLVLLKANPLDDLSHVAKRAGVMVRGRWLPEPDIQARLQRIAAAAAK